MLPILFFAEYVAAIVADLDTMSYDKDRTLNMRASIAFSSADPQYRKDVQLSHQEAMKLAEVAPNTLKRLERTQRRIERLIDMLEANDKKKG